MKAINHATTFLGFPFSSSSYIIEHIHDDGSELLRNKNRDRLCTVCSRISGERAFYPDTMCPLCAASQNTRSKCTLHNLHTAVQSTLLQLLSLPPDTIKYTCATVRK